MKSYDELTIQDNFIFQKIMRNKRICKQTLERLLNIDIRDISYPEEEKTIDVRLDSKSIRMDVYVNDDKGTIYNIEMQTSKDMEELVKRARYYQALIDIDLLEKGQDYETLNNTFVIFICTFEVFSGKLHKYTFRNLCVENHGIELEDGTTKMFLSTKGEADDIAGPLKIFLDYMDGHAPADDFTKEIDSEVVVAKKREEWRREYMTLALEIEKEKKVSKMEGLIEGKSEGKSIVNRLNQILLSANRYDDLERATNDAAYQEELIKELLPDEQ
ncbi:Rpn family recombination-promoting nuclease/putative transposase [Anaerovibrio lipolyticus]|uniref:Rpn family recombination-promoting nuclease/putative transposase n=1 Tax=Anaerovibrio lipolyticus TaxID=82374 RepID=UPI00055FB6FE|nr:Rpn family recombination-promoting nuclease/putative transposase [Anaerovibrio lipolyticus]